MKKILALTAAATAFVAAPAAAQDGTEFYAGATAGYHDVTEIDFTEIGLDQQTGVNGAIFGGFAGVTLPTEGNMVLGLEGTVMGGTDSIDMEYGVSGIVGTRIGTDSRVYARAGYHWVDLDIEGIANNVADDFGFTGAERALLIAELEAGLDGEDTGDGYLLGIGADFGLGSNAFVRANVDTVEFDTVRATAGLGLRF